MTMSEYLTVSEAARLLGVSEKTIRRRVKDGTLASERFGGMLRVREDSLPWNIRKPRAPRPAPARGEFGQIAREVTAMIPTDIA